ncbi:tyrosine-type recombinase/integrase [Vibrio splendidus]|uniref:Uncharacterized protein n=2 Tax=Vibrio TaxID=662 RepID=A0A2N7CAQ6_VIBSP|nr:tyrosine-type recombinase/integrase [Vibrio splendidus]PMF18739.1 hypothetical protein BCV19_15160 [Vibrio splendidus]
MSQVLEKLVKRYEEIPFVTFDSEGKGKSRLYDISWDFTSSGQNKKKVGFEHIEDVHRKNVQSYLFAVIEYQKEQSASEQVTVSTLIRYVVDMNRLICHWGCSDFSLLSDEREWKKVKRKIRGLWSENTLQGITGRINAMSDAGLIARYVKREEYVKLKSKRARLQHIALPEAIHVNVLIQVVECVEKYHSHRHAISEVMGKAIVFRDKEYALELKKHGVSELHKRQTDTFNLRVSRSTNKMAQHYGIPDFRVRFDSKWLNDLLRQCLICVGLFCGARIMELLSMNKDSYDIKNGIPIVQGYQSKGNDGQHIYTTWNTHPIVKQALELAMDATQSIREYHQEKLRLKLEQREVSQDEFNRGLEELDSAFISCHLGRRDENTYRFNADNQTSGIGLTLFNIQATVEDVEEFDLLNPSRAGTLILGSTLPKFSPHDLRRSFAVFVIRNRLGNEQTLKYQLKHKNLNMPRWYANYAELVRTTGLLMDKDLMEECDKAMEEAALDALNDIYNVSETLSGVEGKKISENKMERLLKGEQVYMSRDELRALLRSKEKALVVLPTGGYCTSRDCERLCSMTDITEGKKSCGKVITDKGAKRMARERDELIRSFRDMNAFEDYAYSTLLSARKKKILLIEQTLDAHKIPYEKFTDRIKVVSA